MNIFRHVHQYIKNEENLQHQMFIKINGKCVFMGKQIFNITKKILGMLLVVFFVASVTSTAVSADNSHHRHHNHYHHYGYILWGLL
jgi:hypothetical protein